jgi:multidrug transporter EmrE-like cation transporter
MDFGLILLLIGAIIDTLGDIIMKKWVVSKNWLVFITGMLVYTLGLGFLAFSYKYKNIAIASIIFVILNIIVLSIVSWIYFKEPLSAIQITGILLGIIAVIILELA